MTQEETKTFISQCRENTDKLNNCQQHNFPGLLGIKTMRDKFTCSNCGGTVDLPRARWYMMGFKHGQGLNKTREAK